MVADENVQCRISWTNAMRRLMLSGRAWLSSQREHCFGPSQTTGVLTTIWLQLFACWDSQCRQRCGRELLSANIHGTSTYFAALSYHSPRTPQIIGGLHLAGTELVVRIPPTVDYLSNRLRPSPVYILPMHCSGFAAKVALEDAFGDGCVPAGVGHKIIVEGNQETDRMMHTPAEKLIDVA